MQMIETIKYSLNANGSKGDISVCQIVFLAVFYIVFEPNHALRYYMEVESIPWNELVYKSMVLNIGTS